MKKNVLVCALAVALTWCSCDKDDDDDDNNDNVNATDREFVMKASMGNTAEIDAGEMAAEKSVEPGIQDYGQMMVTDHSTALSDLKGIANDLALYAPDSLDAEHVALKAQLQSLGGREFDSVYIHSQVMDHEKTIQLFQNQVNNGRNNRLKDYANGLLPHLNHHLEKADSIASNY